MTDNDIKELRSLAAADRLVGMGDLARLTDALLAERERLVTEKDALQDVYNSVFDESLRIAKERDALLAEVESLRKDLAGLESVRREQAAGRDYWAKERDSLRDELRDTEVELARARNERDALLAERERLVKENERLAKDFDVARAFHDVAVKERNYERVVSARFATERDALRADAEIGKVVWGYIDRMNDVCDEDPADKIVREFVAAVMPKINAASDAARKERK